MESFVGTFLKRDNTIVVGLYARGDDPNKDKDSSSEMVLTVEQARRLVEILIGDVRLIDSFNGAEFWIPASR